MIAIDKPKCVAPTADVCGEGAVWHSGEQAVYWTDINRFLIHRLTPADGCVKSWVFDEPVTALVLTSVSDTLIAVLGSRAILWKPRTDVRQALGFSLDGWPDVRCNDARADPEGSLWIGSMANNVNPDGSAGSVNGSKGVLFRVDPDRSVTLWKHGIGISNTLAWNPERARFYTADTLANIVYVYEYERRTREIRNEQPFFCDFSRGYPDGSAMDSEGYLWNCRYGGRCIVRVAPNGNVDRVIEMPVDDVTTCTFGGADLRTLYVTTASAAWKAKDRFAGGLFALETSVQGQPENRFSLADSPLLRDPSCFKPPATLPPPQ